MAKSLQLKDFSHSQVFDAKVCGCTPLYMYKYMSLPLSLYARVIPLGGYYYYY